MEDGTTGSQPAFDELITLILARFASGTSSRDRQAYPAEPERNCRVRGCGIRLRGPSGRRPFPLEYRARMVCRCAPSQLADFQQVPMGSWDWAEQVLLAGKVLKLNRMEEDIPREAENVLKQFQDLGFKSSLQVPTRGPGGQITGCIALTSLVREVTWIPADIARVRLVGEAIANAMERARVERELRESEARYRATFDRAPVAILNIARNGRLLRANQRFCEMLGYEREEIVGKDFSAFTHPDDLAATAKLVETLLADGGASPPLETRYLRRDGQVVWGNMTLSSLTDDETHGQVLIAAIEDITPRKQAEEIFDAVPDLIFVSDCQHRVVRVNQATVQRLGMTRQEVLGRPCSDVIHVTAQSERQHLPLAADGQAHRFETHQPHLGGDFLVSCTPLRNARGELTGTVHVARDVTELRESEAALRRAHEQLEQRRALVVAASLDGVWEWEAASENVLYSDRFAELIGYQPSEVPQTLDFFRSVLHPDDAESVWAAVDHHLSVGYPYDVECRLRTKEGTYRWFRTRGQAQRDTEGRPTWMAGSLQDIHAQKSAETELRKALEEVERLTERLRAENIYLQEEISSSLGFDEIVGKSEPLRSVLVQVEHVAPTGASVLLLGETGTGKELLARAIHERSPRKERPLVRVNLAALPSSLIESELFGHVKGAFTGAVDQKSGRFQLADGGTLFLDEIGELNPVLQTKLLRVLQEGEFERIGSTETQTVDVRIVAATNRNLRQAMERNNFRPDLYYRLAVFPIDVPPLRLRRDDIPLLTWHFIARKQGRLGKTIDSIPAKVMQALMEYDWPGNVRELENVIERAMILANGTTLSLPEPLKHLPRLPRDDRATSRPEIDRAQIIAALEASQWKIKGAGNAAEMLGLKPSTFRYRMKVLGIQRPGA